MTDLEYNIALGSIIAVGLIGIIIEIIQHIRKNRKGNEDSRSV